MIWNGFGVLVRWRSHDVGCVRRFNMNWDEDWSTSTASWTTLTLHLWVSFAKTTFNCASFRPTCPRSTFRLRVQVAQYICAIEHGYWSVCNPTFSSHIAESMLCAGQETAESTSFKRANLSVKMMEWTRKFTLTDIQSTTFVNSSLYNRVLRVCRSWRMEIWICHIGWVSSCTIPFGFALLRCVMVM